MNSIAIRIFSVALLICAIVDPVLGAEPPISVEEVAKIFGYPVDKLKVEDVTTEANRRSERKGKPSGISAHDFSGHDNTFARFSIVVTDEGTLLTDDIKRKVAEAIIGLKHIAGTNLYFKWLSFDDAGYGVSGLGMVGAGGSDERSVMTLFNKMDVQVTISTGEAPLEVLPGAEAYHDLITEGGIADKLIECLNTVASKVAGKPIKAMISATPPPGALPDATAPPRKQAQRPAIQAPAQPQEMLHGTSGTASAGAEQPESRPKKLWWVLSGVIVLILVFWRVTKRRPAG